MEIFNDERIKELIKIIKDTIDGTLFQNHVFICGGAVRDALLGLPIKDVDICVDTKGGGIGFATYLAVRNKCFREGTNPVLFPTYKTAMVQLRNNEYLKDINIECVSSKKSPNENGTLQEDVNRRDLTINSMMYCISRGILIDYTEKGISDLASQTLRTPNDPSKILKEDPIKILRIIRFSTQLGWGIEKNTWLAMIENAHLINTVAQERITDEVNKILLCKTPSVGLRKMYYCGILHRIMQDIYDMTNVKEIKSGDKTTFDHTMDVLDAVQPELDVRLAALFHDVGKIVGGRKKHAEPDKFSSDIAAIDLKAMKYPNRIINAVEKTIRYHRAFANYADGTLPPDKKIRKFLNVVGTDYIRPTFDLMNANNIFATYDKKKQQVIDILNRIEEMQKQEESSKIKLPINGNDIINELHVKNGKHIGIILDKVRDAYFENPNITKDEAFEIAEAAMKALTV